MHILFLLTQDLESPAGAGRYYPLARALARRGHAVAIAALHSNYSALESTRFQKEGVDIYYVGPMHVRKQGNVKTYYPASRLVPLIARATWALSRAALSLPADIIHIGKPHPMNSLAGLAARVVRRRCVFLDCDDYEAVNNRFGGVWQQRIVRLFEDYTPRYIDHITVHTHFLHARTLSLGVAPDRVTYLPHGLDLQRFTSAHAEQVNELRSKLGLEDQRVVAFIGSMSLTSHAVDLLISAFERVRRVRPASVLLLAGGGEDFEQLQRQVIELGLEGAVRLCGKIPPEQVPLYYQLADVSVDAVRDNPAGQASISLKMFESWAAGIPLITVDVGDRRKIAGETEAALVVPPGDARAMAGAILRIMNEPELAAVLRSNGRQQASQYSWDRLAGLLETQYIQALGRRHQRAGDGMGSHAD